MHTRSGNEIETLEVNSSWKFKKSDKDNLEYTKDSGAISSLAINVYPSSLAVYICFNASHPNYHNFRTVFCEAGFIKSDPAVEFTFNPPPAKDAWLLHVSDMGRGKELIDIIELYEPFKEEKNKIFDFFKNFFKTDINSLEEKTKSSTNVMLSTLTQNTPEKKLTMLQEAQLLVLGRIPEEKEADRNDNHSKSNAAAKTYDELADDLLESFHGKDEDSEEDYFVGHDYDEEAELAKAIAETQKVSFGRSS